MGCLPNETDPMPPSGHPMREVRLTPWEPIRKRHLLPHRRLSANLEQALADNSNLSLKLALFARPPTLQTIENIDLHEL
jgi:hypothetical protein